MQEKKVAIIGCGNLGRAIANGLLAQGNILPEHITVTRRNTGLLTDLASQGVSVTSDNAAAIQASDLIIVALKPYNMEPILKELNHQFVSGKHSIVSLATGISIDQIDSCIDVDIPIFRAMPNTAADVKMSMTCIATNSKDEDAISLVKNYFDAIGESIFINESLMDSATVLGACGIAYVLRFIRAMIQGGITIGFDAKTATQIVNNTVKGAAELLIERNEHPEYEIDKVTTPRGCTIAGLNEMEHNGFSSALIKGIVTSFEEIG